MNLAVLGSGSRGNATAIWDRDTAILIDAGFGIRTLTRRLKTAGITPGSIRGIVITHEHSDHARGAAVLAQSVGCPVWASRGTLRALASELDGVELRPLVPDTPAVVAGFALHACPTPHDAAEPLAVRIEHGASTARFGIAQDVGHVTPALRSFLRGCTGVVVEANHDEEMLASGPYPARLRARIAGRLGHLSNADAAELLTSVLHAGLEFVVLSHVSQQNNRTSVAEATVGSALRARGFGGRLLVASQDDPLPVHPDTWSAQYALPLH